MKSQVPCITNFQKVRPLVMQGSSNICNQQPKAVMPKKKVRDAQKYKDGKVCFFFISNLLLFLFEKYIFLEYLTTSPLQVKFVKPYLARLF
jgi:hypothetical protein